MHEQMISVANPGTLLLSGRIRIHEACHVRVSGNLWKVQRPISAGYGSKEGGAVEERETEGHVAEAYKH